jgi:tripartite-type tricarboxylate transporter receptor subunit TctC
MLKILRVRPAILVPAKRRGLALMATPSFVVFSSYVVNPSLFAKVPYDPYKDFDPVTLAVTSTTVLVVNPSVPAKNVSELVVLIRANPGKYSYAHGGVGAATHLAGEQFRLSLGLDLVPIPFNAGGPSTAAVVAGHTPIGFCQITPVVPQI